MNALAQTLSAADLPPQLGRTPYPQANGTFSSLRGFASFSTAPATETFKKPPGSEGLLLPTLVQTEGMFLEGRRVIDEQLSQLRALYIFSPDNALERFLGSRRSLVSLLHDAAAPLRAAFGKQTLFALELSVEEDHSCMVYGIALWRGSVPAAAQAFDQFVENWWLDHMSKDTTDLAFVYKISR